MSDLHPRDTNAWEPSGPQYIELDSNQTNENWPLTALMHPAKAVISQPQKFIENN